MVKETTVTSKKRRWYFISLGLLLGYLFNYRLSQLSGSQDVLNIALSISIAFFCFIFIYWFLSRVKYVDLPFFTMVRLSFLGIAIASFSYAFLDVFIYFSSVVNVASFLSSIALGGFLSVFERLLDLRERKEL